ncbi:MAG: glutathione S-transferase family protein [Burkholderiaceae bacterium]|nr:glutathione S-transferase family protein [Burkholderiaceae bacterium]
MRLYHHPVSSNSRRVIMAAIHMGTPLETTEVNLLSQEDRRRLEELNPNSKVPVLQDGEFILWESCAIMQYLADRTLDQTLYPDNIMVRADINRWMLWACQHFSPALGILTYERIWKGVRGLGGPDPVEIARGEKQILQFATVLNKHLENREWMVADKITLADYAVAAPLMYIEQARLPLGEYQHIMQWFDRIQQLDAWQKTIPVW